MRASRRNPSRRLRRVVPARSRLTVRRAVAALRRGRDALSALQGQLDSLLLVLRTPETPIADEVPQGLATTTEEASAALELLDNIRQLLPQRGGFSSSVSLSDIGDTDPGSEPR
jgi:hypothetical protein